MAKYNPEYLDEEERQLIEPIEEIDTATLKKSTATSNRKVQRAAGEYLQRQGAKMNIRIDPHELELIKQRAAKEGLKYQSLVKSVLHKYVTGQLVEPGEKAV
jgi:predicted DNA binding CopG/RHH family protein